VIFHVVVVLSYYGREDTLSCVESILSGDTSIHPLVVDNGSCDGVVEAAAARFGDQISTLQLATNTGFTGGMNSGLHWALERGADVITVLNNDTTCRPGALTRLAETATRHHAAVTPEIRYRSDTNAVWFAGGTIDPATGLARHLGDGELAPPDAQGLRPTDVLTGCSVTAQSAVWRRVGQFDDRYFLNFEDSDWSVRARAARVPLIVDTAAVIEHQVAASFAGAYSYLGLYFYVRNGITFVRERSGGGPLTAARFVRHHVVPRVRPRVTTGGLRAACRRAVVVMYAARDLALRRWGPAPRSLQLRATKWSESDMGEKVNGE